MKGIFKGFKYISNIFEPPKEQEIQIGFPTDVKHVAHIGWDGPTVTPPSWMNEFKSAPLSGAGDPTGEFGESNINFPSHDLSSGTSDALAKDTPEKVHKPSRRNRSVTESPLDSPAREGGSGSHHGAPKPSRRNNSSVDSSSADAPNTTRHSRRHKSSECLDPSSGEGSARRGRRSSRTKEQLAGSESPDLPSIPKHVKKKKSKGGATSTSEGSSRRAKAQAAQEEERASTASSSDAVSVRPNLADEDVPSVATMPTIEEKKSPPLLM